MGILDILLLGLVAAGCIGAIRFLKKNGTGCGGCTGDCGSCKRNRK